MLSDEDLEAAVAAGVIDRAALDRLRAFRAAGAAPPDEEHFRLLTGFNDIFVAIALVLVLGALAWLGVSAGDTSGDGLNGQTFWLGGALVAAGSWALAEPFTRRRRLALPSILLLAGFVGGVFALVFAGALAIVPTPTPDASRVVMPLLAGLAAVCAAGAAWLHWRRYRVPITVAAGAGALVVLAASIYAAAVPGTKENLTPICFAAGLCVFAFAMRWDMSDPERTTRRADVAFWLHLLAAPLIVHPVFAWTGVLGASVGIGAAVLVLALYVVLALVALAIDRRALMVSALAYVLFALSALFRQAGALTLNAALTGLVIGSALLLLSAWWATARGAVVARLPAGWRTRLPRAARLLPA